MAERFTTWGEAAVGTSKTVLNIFNPVATPLTRARVYDISIGCSASPADQATKFRFARTSAVGTEGTGLVPENVDPAGPAGEYDSGYGHSAEPTFVASSELLVVSINQRATFRWVAAPESEFILTATQNNGAALQSVSSTGTAIHQSTVLFSA
jgi:hypothetical protein